MTNSKIQLSVLWLAAFLMAACTDKVFEEEESPELVPMTFEALPEATRTALDGTSVVWSEGDEVAVYDFKASKHRFTSITTGGRTKFVGKVTAKSEPFAAIYPYDLASETGSSAAALSATLPAEQYAVADGFPSGMNISVAKGARNIDGSPSSVTFHNACQLLRFTVPDYVANKVTGIIFTAQTAVAGKLNIDYSGISPAVSIASTESKVITVLPPRRTSTFAAGTYYILTAPVQLNGFSMTMQTSDGKTYRLASSTQFGGVAGRIYSLGSIDLVNTPVISAEQVTTGGVLQGTKVIASSAPIEGQTWTVIIKNSSGTTVRTLSGTGDLSSPETDASWPYLPMGDYTVECKYTTSNNRQITKTLPTLSITTKPSFNATLSAYTSYSYYAGEDGVTRSILEANKCANNVIYSPTVRVFGIASRILENDNYELTLTPSGFTGTLKSSDRDVFVYNNVTVSSWGKKDLSVTVSFCGGEVKAQKSVHITGLPYSATTESDFNAWSGGEWTDSKAFSTAAGRWAYFFDGTIYTPQFHIPTNIDINLSFTIWFNAALDSNRTSNFGPVATNGTPSGLSITPKNRTWIDYTDKIFTLTPEKPRIGWTHGSSYWWCINEVSILYT